MTNFGIHPRRRRLPPAATMMKRSLEVVVLLLLSRWASVPSSSSSAGLGGGEYGLVVVDAFLVDNSNIRRPTSLYRRPIIATSTKQCVTNVQENQNKCYELRRTGIASTTTTVAFSTHRRSASRTKTRLLMSSSSSAAAEASQDRQFSNHQNPPQIIYQKVVRPPRDVPDVLFLGSIIQYLEDHFEVPSDLPMIYEKQQQTAVTSDEDNNNNNNNNSSSSGENHCILSWDSPLSPSSLYTQMDVEVVGIYTGSGGSSSSSSGDDKSTSVPNMAMVVVKKKQEPKGSQESMMPPMMKNLFDDSERKILQELDRGLDDFVEGKIKFDVVDNNDRLNNNDQMSSMAAASTTPANVKTAEEAIEAELMMAHDDYLDNNEQPERLQSDKDTNVILDAQVTSKTLSSSSDSSTGYEIDDNDNSNNNDDNESSPALDAVAVAVAAARERAVATMNVQAENNAAASQTKKMDDDIEPKDFAVEAAKRIAEKKRLQVKKSSKGTKKSNDGDDKTQVEDFAVAAARKAAAAITASDTLKKQSSPKTNKSKKSPKVAKVKKTAYAKDSSRSKATQGSPLDMSEGEDFRAYESMSRYRPIYQSISHPQNRLQGKTQRSTSTSSSSSSPPLPTSSLQKKVRRTQQRNAAKKARSKSSVTKQSSIEASSSTSEVGNESDKVPTKDQVGRNRKLNANIIDDEDVDIDTALNPMKNGLKSSLDALNAFSPDDNLPPNVQREIEAMKETNRMMDEMASKTQDMSPEDLLRDILKFDEDQKREETPGSGFVTGAFDKAKELLQERNRKREASNPQVGFKEVDRTEFPQPQVPISSNASQEVSQQKKELTPEEELKAMFAAGQKIANGMITQNIDNSDDSRALSGRERTTEKEVDDLIKGDKSISSYARILDDELAELEVSVNSSPGEELDGPATNPIFDPMSGPEVYDRNVDLDSVNYPGAIPGTKKVRLPKELKEAVQQAEFATGVLMNLETIEQEDGTTKYFAGKRELSTEQVENLQAVVEEASEIGIIDDPVVLMQERSRLQMILDEMWNQPEERFREIASNYKDLLLSDYFVALVRQRMNNMAERDLDALRRDDDSLKEGHAREREILGYLVAYAQLLLKEVRALGAELEAQQLEIIRSICNVAMDPKHTTEEETALALSDAVRDMRPLLDDMFVAYLKYAVAEEEARLARNGLLDDPEHSQWLFVLKIVQQGVYAEIAKGINRYIEHILYIIRMDTQKQRRRMLEKLVDDMPTMDVRPFVQVVDNIVGSLGDGTKGEFDAVVELGEMTNQLLQLHRDLKDVLPPERIAEKSRDADEWAARQKKRMMKQRKLGQQRLRAAKDTEHLEDSIEDLIAGAEVERFD